MPDLQHLLDEIQRLELEICPGPWVANDLGIGYEITTQQQMPINSGIKDTFPRSDAEFIALARTALPTLGKALRAVLDWHQPTETGDAFESDYCPTCGVYSPCPTVQAITDQMEGDDDS